MKAGKFKETDLVTIGNDAWATGNPVFKGSSLMFLKPGMQVPVSQLIRGINLQSGNDACVAMADFAAGSRDAFVGLMNSYVNALGLKIPTSRRYMVWMLMVSTAPREIWR